MDVRSSIFFLLLILPSIAIAQTTRWTLTTADFQSREVNLDAINDAGVRVRDRESDPPRVVTWDNLLALDRALEAKPAPARFTLFLTTGDQLRGEPVKIDGETLAWNAGALGHLDVRLQQVSSIARSSSAAPRQRDATTEDVVSLANGDTVRGIVSGLAEKQLTVQVAGNPTPVPLDSVLAVHFASTAAAAPQTGRALRIRMTDDSLLTVQDARTTGENLALRIGGAERSIPISSLAAIEQLNGPVSWLSSRIPSENVHTPLLQTARPARMDKTITGQPIRFGERTYARGIGVAPRSRITWPLDAAQGYKTFRTRYAIDGQAPYADVTVRVLLDGQVAHERKSFTAGQLSPVVLVPLGNAKSLTLEVDFGSNYNVQDRLNWIEPALIKTSPVPASTRP